MSPATSPERLRPARGSFVHCRASQNGHESFSAVIPPVTSASSVIPIFEL